MERTNNSLSSFSVYGISRIFVSFLRKKKAQRFFIRIKFVKELIINNNNNNILFSNSTTSESCVQSFLSLQSSPRCFRHLRDARGHELDGAVHVLGVSRHFGCQVG